MYNNYYKGGIRMISMQYKVELPNDYDMNGIRKRVEENGLKTDGFQGLYFKAYLMCEAKDNSNGYNEYSPLYLWKDSEGMNEFIFHGFYNHILQSFGWQKINVGVPLQVDINLDFKLAAYMIEIESMIAESVKMNAITYSFENEMCIGKVLLYNPEKWICKEYYFFKEKPEVIEHGRVYRVLHISMG